MSQVYRVLSEDGVFLYITFRQPHFVKPLINADNRWQLEEEVLREGESTFDYYGFVLKNVRAAS